MIVIVGVEIQALTLSHHHHPASPPPSLPCQPRQGGGMVSYQRFWKKTGGRRQNPAHDIRFWSRRGTILQEFLRFFESFWGPNMRGRRCHLLRVFREEYFKNVFCLRSILRVFALLALKIQRIPPVLLQFSSFWACLGEAFCEEGGAVAGGVFFSSSGPFS